MEDKEEKVSLKSMETLARIMNDSPTIVKMANTEFPITALKPGTQWLISEESCKILKVEKDNTAGVITQFSKNMESVVKIITLAILNDKDRIFSDFKKRIYSEEYESVYQTILWDTDSRNWINLLYQVMNLLDIEGFFGTTSVIAIIREMALERKMTIKQQK